MNSGYPPTCGRAGRKWSWDDQLEVSLGKHPTTPRPRSCWWLLVVEFHRRTPCIMLLKSIYAVHVLSFGPQKPPAPGETRARTHRQRRYDSFRILQHAFARPLSLEYPVTWTVDTHCKLPCILHAFPVHKELPKTMPNCSGHLDWFQLSPSVRSQSQ